MNIIKKTLAFISTAALLGVSFAPAAFAQGTDIANNGAFSSNAVSQTNTQSSTTVQDNSANFNNSVSVSSNTGGNTADFNTGGSTAIGTGNSVTGVQITNMANMNQANLGSNQDGAATQLPVTISGNGAESANNVSNTNTQDQSLFQTNAATFNNTVAVNSNTGDNTSDFGVNGNSTILTGKSQTQIGIDNMANGNVATNSNPTTLSLLSPVVSNNAGPLISGNGAFSANSAALSNTNSSLVEQNNSAFLNNAVEVTANTGDNSATYNTGGSQLVSTGMASLVTGITNETNFNSATIPDGNWLAFQQPVVAANGAFSQNAVSLAQERVNSLFQGGGENNGNQFTANNTLAFDPSTGVNATGYNTLPLNGLSEVLTGPSSSSVLVNNTGNVNTAGNSLGSMMLPGGMQLNLGFNLGSLFHLQ